MPHVQTPVIIILVISIHDIRMIIPMIAGQILIGIHNIIIFNIILMIVPVVLIIIPFIISSLSTLILFTNWHWYCFSRCKNIDLTYIPINILTELYTVNHCSIILRYHNYWTKVPNYIYNCTYIYISLLSIILNYIHDLSHSSYHDPNHSPHLSQASQAAKTSAELQGHQLHPTFQWDGSQGFQAVLEGLRGVRAKALHHMGFERDYHGIMELWWDTIGLEWNDIMIQEKMALERDDDWGFKPATIGWALTVNGGITHLQTSLGGLWNIKLNHNEVAMLNIEDIHDTAEWINLMSLSFLLAKTKACLLFDNPVICC